MPDFKLINAQLAALLANETNLIANLANASALLNDSVDQLNWTGFYLYDPKGDELVLETTRLMRLLVPRSTMLLTTPLSVGNMP